MYNLLCLKFRLISWCGNFVERHSFRIVSGDSPEAMRKLYLSTKFLHPKIRWNFGNYVILQSGILGLCDIIFWYYEIILPDSVESALHHTKNEAFLEGFLQYMWPNPQETADFVSFTEENLNGKLHSLCKEFYGNYFSAPVHPLFILI